MVASSVYTVVKPCYIDLQWVKPDAKSQWTACNLPLALPQISLEAP